MAARDGPIPTRTSLDAALCRGQLRYLRECAPQRRADVLVDNTDPDRPRLVRIPRIAKAGRLSLHAWKPKLTPIVGLMEQEDAEAAGGDAKPRLPMASRYTAAQAETR